MQTQNLRRQIDTAPRVAPVDTSALTDLETRLAAAEKLAADRAVQIADLERTFSEPVLAQSDRIEKLTKSEAELQRTCKAQDEKVRATDSADHLVVRLAYN